MERAGARTGNALPEPVLRYLLRSTILESLGLDESASLDEDADLYSMGIDSLMAVNIRNKLAKQLNTGGTVLPLNVVYEKPTIKALARYLYQLGNGVVEEKKQSPEEMMSALVDKYSNFSKFVPRDAVVTGKHIVYSRSGCLGVEKILTHNS